MPGFRFFTVFFSRARVQDSHWPLEGPGFRFFTGFSGFPMVVQLFHRRGGPRVPVFHCFLEGPGFGFFTASRGQRSGFSLASGGQGSGFSLASEDPIKPLSGVGAPGFDFSLVFFLKASKGQGSGFSLSSRGQGSVFHWLGRPSKGPEFSPTRPRTSNSRFSRASGPQGAGFSLVFFFTGSRGQGSGFSLGVRGGGSGFGSTLRFKFI